MKKRVLSILLVFSIIVCGLSSFAFGGAAADTREFLQMKCTM